MENDVYEEITIPEVDYAERMNLLRHLDQRQKDREELELEEVFQSLRKQVDNDQEIDTLSSYSMQEIKEERQINIYKPTLKKNVKKETPVVIENSP